MVFLLGNVPGDPSKKGAIWSRETGVFERCLQGEAKKVIQSMGNAETNYQIAIELLTRRFGDKETIEAELISELWRLKPVLDVRDLKGQTEFMDNLERIVRSLQALGIERKEIGRALKPVLYDKVPYGWRIEFERLKLRRREERTSSGEAFEDFLDLMRSEITVRTRASVGCEEKKVKEEKKSEKEGGGSARKEGRGPKPGTMSSFAGTGRMEFVVAIIWVQSVVLH